MNFQDNEKNSVQSLLALLRSTQDGSTTTTSAASGQPGPSSQQTAQATNARTLARSTSGTLATSTIGTVPSTQQLNDLLRSLNPPPATSLASTGRPLASPSSAVNASRNLIEPFGPITNLTNPSAANRTSGSSRPTQTFTERDAASSTESNAEAVEASGNVEERGTMSFAKALPRLGEMMGDERFMSELRKMKADQDALERRLWAKQEKIKAEHERSIQAERDIARIAQRPIPPEKKAQWAANLDLTLRDFHLQTCLPSLDSLSKRQKARLEEMGVPGLGGDAADERIVARWRKIMDLLQAGLEE